MGIRKQKISGISGALWLALLATAAAEEGGWTDNLRSNEGHFAFRADTANRRVLLLRADQRGGPDGRSYRIRLAGGAAGALVVPLRRSGAGGPPWKFGAEVKGWDGVADSAELEVSDDGKRWRTLGRFRRSGD